MNYLYHDLNIDPWCYKPAVAKAIVNSNSNVSKDGKMNFKTENKATFF